MQVITRRTVAVLAALAALATASRADIIIGSSNAHGVSTSVSLLTLNLTVGPVAMVSGNAPGTYSFTDQVLSVNASSGLLGGLSTGVVTTNASSDIDGGAGARFAMGDATIDGLSLTLVPGILLTPDLLSLSATTITSSSSVSGDFGAISAVGTSIIEDAQLRILGANVTVGASAAPNTVVFDALGIRVVLNEQIMTGNGVDSRGLTTNAIHISLNDVLAGGGLVNGDVVIGHSFGQMSAVPEPASLLVLGGALAALAARRRRP